MSKKSGSVPAQYAGRQWWYALQRDNGELLSPAEDYPPNLYPQKPWIAKCEKIKVVKVIVTLK
jgi:hypothetical protein